MIRPPPRSTLFPTRRSSDLRVRSCRLYCYHLPPETFECLDECAGRSEEHTSELQSHSDLVCRLLLEKKKKVAAELERIGRRAGTKPAGLANEKRTAAGARTD